MYQKCAFGKQKTRTYLIAGGEHRKTNKVMKVLHLKCAPVTGRAKGSVMAYDNRRLLDRPGNHHQRQ